MESLNKKEVIQDYKRLLKVFIATAIAKLIRAIIIKMKINFIVVIFIKLVTITIEFRIIITIVVIIDHFNVIIIKRIVADKDFINLKILFIVISSKVKYL